MKTAFRLILTAFSLILLCCTQLVNAQPYPSIFGTEKTQYNILMNFKPMSVKSTFWGGTDIFTFENDTIIDQKVYKKVDYVYGYDYRGLFSGIREDTVEDKIFVYQKDIGEVLTCDFSLSVGDTFFFPQHKCIPHYNHYCLNEHHGFMIADSIYFENDRKIITFDGPYYGNGERYYLNYFSKVSFIEGIGPNYGPLGWFFDDLALLCAYKDDNLVYKQWEDIDCEYTNLDGNIKELPYTPVSITPNPVVDGFYLQNNGAVFEEVFIYSIHGQCVKQLKLQHPSQKIDISTLPTGIYLLKAIDEQGRVYSGKVVKK